MQQGPSYLLRGRSGRGSSRASQDDSPQTETRPASRQTQGSPGATWLPPGRNVLAVAAGGAVGGSLRYGFIQAFPGDPGGFPWVVFCENMIGAFLLGLILTLVLHRQRWAWDVRPFLCTGILGSFTTFSNYTLDIVTLGWGGWPGTALVYSLGSIVLGVVAASLGIASGRILSGARG